MRQNATPQGSRRPFAWLAISVMLLAAMMTGGCGGASQSSSGRGSSRESTPVAELKKVEVRSYNGKRLDSIGALRENSIRGPQNVDLTTYRLKVSGAGIPRPVSYTYDEVLALPAFKKNVTLYCVEGWKADLLWEGVKLSDLFTKAGYGTMALPKGAAPKIVVFRCADGYSTSLPFDYVNSRDILLAYKENGVALPTRFGFPFQVVAEDRWGYKWAKWVTAIELSTDDSFRGYWEQRGYDNDATLPSK